MKRRSSDYSQNKPPSAPIAALLAWVLPGLGHWWIGERARGIVFLVGLTSTFWGGVAVAGVRSAVSPRDNGPWIAAQLCMGPQAFAAMLLSVQIAQRDVEHRYTAAWPASNIGVVYAGVAGLLNLLVIIDVLARVEARQAMVTARAPPNRAVN